MSANPYKLGQVIDGNEPLFFDEYKVYDINGVLLRTLIYDYGEKVTLNKIRNFILMKYKSKIEVLNNIPFLRVHCDIGIWGVIFETGNYGTNKWCVYGVTKGYA